MCVSDSILPDVAKHTYSRKTTNTNTPINACCPAVVSRVTWPVFCTHLSHPHPPSNPPLPSTVPLPPNSNRPNISKPLASPTSSPPYHLCLELPPPFAPYHNPSHRLNEQPYTNTHPHIRIQQHTQIITQIITNIIKSTVTTLTNNHTCHQTYYHTHTYARKLPHATYTQKFTYVSIYTIGNPPAAETLVG